MRLIRVILLTFWTGCGYLSAQDTSLIHQNLPLYEDSCEHYVGAVYYGCGYPEFDVKICAGSQLINLRIFDRWGRVVFETREYPVNWDYRDLKGNLLEPDAYVYYLELKSAEGVFNDLKGTFHLMR